MKIAINKCYGGFSVSKAAVLWLAEHGLEAAKNEVAENDALVEKFGADRGGPDDPDYLDKWKSSAWANGDSKSITGYSWHFHDDEIMRHEPALIECIEAIGKQANGPCAELKIVEIPNGIEYEIQEYDGIEWIAEKHQTWG